MYNFINKLFREKTDSIGVQFFRYLLVGGTAFVVDFGILYILTDKFSIYYLVSAAISFLIGLSVNYFLSTYWVFSERAYNNHCLEFFFFGIIGIVGLLFNQFFIWLFTSVLLVHYLWSKMITAIIVYFWNFFARKYLIFRKKA